MAYPASTASLPLAVTDVLRFEQNGQVVVATAQELGLAPLIEEPAYAAAIEVSNTKAKDHLVKPEQLTGALTVNATTVTNHDEGDEFTFRFDTDGTQRIVTFGTNFLASGTVTIPANKTATVKGRFMDSKISITSREISA